MDRTKNLKWNQKRGMYVRVRPATVKTMDIEPRLSRDQEGIQDSKCGICGKVCDEPQPVDFYVRGTSMLVCKDCMPHRDDMAKLFLLLHPDVTDAEARRIFPKLERSPTFEAALAEARRNRAVRT